MPRRATGQVMKRTRIDSTVYALRFNAKGRRQYVTLGSSRDGWNQAKAQDAAGGPMNASNVRNRILTPAVARANERLEAADATPLPESLTPHKLRHTFALLVALGTDPGAVMDQLGHTDPTFTLRVYRHGMRRDEDSRAQLAQLVGDVKRHRKGTSPDYEGVEAGIGSKVDSRNVAL